MKGYMVQRGNGFRLMVYLGRDPVTGKKQYKTETVRGTKREAQRRLAHGKAHEDHSSRIPIAMDRGLRQGECQTKDVRAVRGNMPTSLNTGSRCASFGSSTALSYPKLLCQSPKRRAIRW